MKISKDTRLFDQLWLVTLRTSAILTLLKVTPAVGQIVPDGTLPNPSQISIEGDTFTLDGGTETGSNLFHSFQDFSVPTGSEAFFNNATNIENILTRVTGSNISNIDGLIRANGTANLFLINPNGIVFGQNARLDLGGSFFATTADSILFENGLDFSATSPEAQPLLSVSVPVGLQFGTPAAALRVEGSGHALVGFSSGLGNIPVVGAGNSEVGLSVVPNRTIALVGGNMTLDGGLVNAPDGRIELGAVETGSVGLNSTPSGWTLDYTSASSLGDIQLLNQALADTSGPGVSTMQVCGRTMEIRNGSMFLMQHSGSQPDGTLAVNLSDRLTIEGMTFDSTLPSGLRTSAIAEGQGANISLTANQLCLINGGSIGSFTFGEGRSGNTNLNISESVLIEGFSSRNPGNSSGIFANAFGVGLPGSIDLSTQRLSVRNGGTLVSSVLNQGVLQPEATENITGNVGDITIDASKSVELSGTGPLVENGIFSVTLTRHNSGRITINTGQLLIRDGATLSTGTVASGNAGRITVNASESIVIIGQGGNLRSRLDSSAETPRESVRPLVGLETLTGDAGSLILNTPVLQVLNGGRVSTFGEGAGDGGTLHINANSILVREGELTASTTSGEGGNILLNVENDTILRRGGTIAAEAGEMGDGGNIAIDSESLTLLQGSHINANAFEGQGGNIEIVTQGLFASPDSRLTASSQLGVDGIVAVTQPEIDTSSALVQLSEEPIDPTMQIVSACSAARDSSFVVTGNGGLPLDPIDDFLRGQDVWVDLQLTEIRESNGSNEEEDHEESSLEPQLMSEVDGHRETEPPDEQVRGDAPTEVLDSDLVEANRWHIDGNGNVELVSSQSRNAPFVLLDCLSDR
ncbi:filamentous hemagglutinin N-terminal domain-containing protein [Geitlerinema sp. CS-897]|nr:filamentous hemagglutinin N-terminal domain-containing protein [Geitlerinema sp. CS-897]